MYRNLYLHRRQLMVIAFGGLIVAGGWLVSQYRENATDNIAYDTELGIVHSAASNIACSKYIPSIKQTICFTESSLCPPNWPTGNPSTPCSVVLP